MKKILRSLSVMWLTLRTLFVSLMPGGGKHTTCDYISMLRLLVRKADLDIREIRASPTGIHLKLKDSRQVAQVAEIANSRSWIVTRRTDQELAIEPRYTPSVLIGAGTKLYHVSDKRNRDSICANGLRPLDGGNTTFNREYPRAYISATGLVARWLSYITRLPLKRHELSILLQEPQQRQGRWKGRGRWMTSTSMLSPIRPVANSTKTAISRTVAFGQKCPFQRNGSASCRQRNGNQPIRSSIRSRCPLRMRSVI
ncbi:hypothetical protein DC522_19390 [Microvirga sp. KLBC 81]|nr:hypothetical protein DC522_19390 [Microvirga sp. KLBC 81]